MNASGLIDRFLTGTYNVTRPASVTYDETGTAQADDAPTVFDVAGCMQPVTGADLKRLPEGTNIDEVRALWAAVELLPGDRIGIGPETWQVNNVQDWSTLGGYWKALCTKP